jgi:hypothetical protein
VRRVGDEGLPGGSLVARALVADYRASVVGHAGHASPGGPSEVLDDPGERAVAVVDRALSYANGVLTGRRRVRQALAIPPDDLDRSARSLGDVPFGDEAELIDDLADHPPPREVRVLFWPRVEVVRAHDRWPQLVQHADANAVARDREKANRELSEAGIARITMVPLTTARLTEFAARTGGDPTDEVTRIGCMAEIIEDGGVIAWPPPRHALRWCGSATKYKRCCGRPSLH